MVMKTRRGVNTLILFRNKDNFEAYDKDAEVVSETLKLKTFIENGLKTVKFPALDIEKYSKQLLDAGHSICISEMRDGSGDFITNIAQDEYE